MALYPPAIKKLIPPGPNDPPIKPRVLIFHVAASEGPSLYGYFNGPSGGIESHFYIRYDGTVEQYRSTDVQADANTDANGFAISAETEGLEFGKWTTAQLAAIKALTLWCHATHGIPLKVPAAWDAAGVGYHTLFPGVWDKRGASCPGPNRKVQFNQVLVPWLTTAAAPAAPKEWDEMATKDDLKAAVREVLQEDGLVDTPFIKSNTSVAPVTALSLAAQWALQARDRAVNPAAIAAAVAATVNPSINVDELARAIVLELGKE